MKMPTRPQALAVATLCVLATAEPSVACADVPSGAAVLPIVGGLLLGVSVVVVLIVAGTAAGVVFLVRRRKARQAPGPDDSSDASGGVESR
jgi:hypothetical protein